jgi:hypothetical protein
LASVPALTALVACSAVHAKAQFESAYKTFNDMAVIVGR